MVVHEDDDRAAQYDRTLGWNVRIAISLLVFSSRKYHSLMQPLIQGVKMNHGTRVGIRPQSIVPSPLNSLNGTLDLSCTLYPCYLFGTRLAFSNELNGPGMGCAWWHDGDTAMSWAPCMMEGNESRQMGAEAPLDFRRSCRRDW